MKDIWQQTEARDDAKELQTHIEEFDGVRRKQRATQVEKEQLAQQQEQPNHSGGVKSVAVNGQDSEGVGQKKVIWEFTVTMPKRKRYEQWKKDSRLKK
jgi:hypothetical protein